MGTFNIAGPRDFTQGRVWAFNSASAVITEVAPVAGIAANSLPYNIPPLTVCHIVLKATSSFLVGGSWFVD